MKMGTKSILALTLLLELTEFVKAQDEIPALITDRPDQTESSAVVPRRFLQIETGFVLANDNDSQAKRKLFAYNTTLLRYGLLTNLELRLGLEYLGEKTELKNTDSTNIVTGLSPAYVGFKVKITDEDGWKPEIAFLGGLVLPFTANSYFKPTHTAGTFRFAFSHTLSDRFSLGYNLGAKWNGIDAVPGFFYSLVFGVVIIDNLGMFVESYGLIPEEENAEHLLDAGFTFLLLPNFQLDVSGGIGLQNSVNNFISFGLTYRLPK
jgi:hypothetical protein